MTQTNYNPSPKDRFQAVRENITAHHAMMERDSFNRACDFAMLEFQSRLVGQTRDGNAAMATGFRIMGAVEFVSILKTLAEANLPPAVRKDLDNLDAGIGKGT